MSSRAVSGPPARSKPVSFPFLALIAGALAMGASPIFVRFAEVGPFASAFWRVALALPALWLWSRFEAQEGTASQRRSTSAILAVLLSGLFFAGDLTVWHLAILKTTVANATFLATLAPVWVVLGSGLVLGEKVGPSVYLGLLLCLAGAGALIGSTISITPENLEGDLYGIATSVFFGAYFLSVRHARRVFGSGRTLFLSSLVTAAVLFAEAILLEDTLWPTRIEAMGALVAMALISHAGGQGLLSFALGHLPAAFSALVIFLEAIAAAVFAWLLLGEALGPLQAFGAVAIFAGIAVARPRSGA